MKKVWAEIVKYQKYMHNGEWQQAAHTTSQLSSSSSTRALQKKAHLLTKNMLLYIPFTNCRLTAQAEAYKKAHLLRKNIGYFSGEKRKKMSGEWTISRKMTKERGLGRGTREDLKEKWHLWTSRQDTLRASRRGTTLVNCLCFDQCLQVDSEKQTDDWFECPVNHNNYIRTSQKQRRQRSGVVWTERWTWALIPAPALLINHTMSVDVSKEE